MAKLQMPKLTGTDWTRIYYRRECGAQRSFLPEMTEDLCTKSAAYRNSGDGVAYCEEHGHMLVRLWWHNYLPTGERRDWASTHEYLAAVHEAAEQRAALLQRAT